MSIPYTGIGHSAFRFNDFERAMDFYTNMLDFEKMFEVKNAQGEVWMAMLRVAPNQYMELFAETYPPHGLEHSFNHMCYSVDDIVATARLLEARGLTLHRGPSFIGQPLAGHYQAELLPGGNYGFYIVDPEGNEVEFMKYTAGSQTMEFEKEKG